jgi:hypothetical protein
MRELLCQRTNLSMSQNPFLSEVKNLDFRLKNDHSFFFKVLLVSFFYWRTTVAVWQVRDCGRFPIKLHEKLKRATTLRIPLKPLFAIPRVVRRKYFQIQIMSIALSNSYND